MKVLTPKHVGKFFLLMAAALLLTSTALCQVRISSHHATGAVSSSPIEFNGGGFNNEAQRVG